MGISSRLNREGEKPGRLPEIVIEEPVENEYLEFDVETEVGELGLINMKSEYLWWCEEEEWYNAGFAAMNFKILFPDRIAELDLYSKWEKMKAEYKKHLDSENWSIVARQAMFLKILFPDKVGQLGLEEFKQSLFENLASEFDAEWFKIFEYVKCVKVLYPDQNITELIKKHSLTTEWDKRCQDLSANLSENKELYRVSCSLMGLRVAFLDGVKINKQQWEEMEGLYRERTQKDLWYNALSEAANLKILSAKEVKVTNQGIELVMGDKEDFKDGLAERPERRLK